MNAEIRDKLSKYRQLEEYSIYDSSGRIDSELNSLRDTMHDMVKEDIMSYIKNHLPSNITLFEFTVAYLKLTIDHDFIFTIPYLAYLKQESYVDEYKSKLIELGLKEAIINDLVYYLYNFPSLLIPRTIIFV